MTLTPVGSTKVRQLLEAKGREVHSVEAGASIVEAAQIMVDRGVGSLVVTRGPSIAGIVTERDCLRHLAASECPPEDAKVDEIMTRDVVAVTPETTLEECMAIMTDKRCRHLPVVEQGKLAGIVSIGDLVKQAVRDHHAEIHYLTEYILGGYPGAATQPAANQPPPSA